MISLSKTKGGKVVAIGTGKITTDPSYRTFDSGKALTSFFINSDSSGKGKSRQYESYTVNCWEDWADYARFFEKGDVVSVQGECVKNDYLSKKNGTDEFTINVQKIELANIGVEVMHLRLLIDDLRKQLGEKPNGDKNGASEKLTPNEQGSLYDYTNINPDDLPFGAGDDDIEPDI